MNMSLRWSVSLLFVGTVILVTALSTAYGVSQSTDEIRSSIVDRQQKSGSGAATSLTYLLDSSRQALASTASVIPAADLRTPTRTGIGPLLDPLIAAHREFSHVALLDETGAVLVARPTPDAFPATLSDHPGFRSTRETMDASLTLDAALGEPSWILPVPSTSPNVPPRYLIGRLNVYFIEDALFANLDPAGQGILFDEQGATLASTTPDYNTTTLDGWDAFDRLRAGEAESVESKSPVTGENVIVTLTSMKPQYPTSVGIFSSKAELTSLQSGLIRSAVLTAVALAVPAVLLGIVATSTILRPVQDVRTATHRMREGDLAARANPRGARELQELAQDFNAMAGTLSREWEERVRLQNHLEELVKERTHQLDQRQQDMEMFFYGVSHDFKSPVISISNITQMLEESLQAKKIDREEMHNFLRRIKNSSLSLQSLIGELLEFAQADRVAPKFQLIGTRALLGPTLEEAQTLANARGVRIETSGREVRLETDPERVRHIVSNLLSNAIKYMPAQTDPWVRVTWSKAPDHLSIRVADNGSGIPDDVKVDLFRPFSRHAGAGSKVAGAGLGLSIVKRLTESLRGTVVLDETHRNGTAFVVKIPLRARKGGK